MIYFDGLPGAFLRTFKISRHKERLISFVLTVLQEGQAKTSCSPRPPSCGIERETFMVSPHDGHTRDGVLGCARGENSTMGCV